MKEIEIKQEGFKGVADNKISIIHPGSFFKSDVPASVSNMNQGSESSGGSRGSGESNPASYPGSGKHKERNEKEVNFEDL